jgi:REP element-mobilizing transposase RayT
MAFNSPKAFLFTFTPYGTRLHGDERGSVDKFHNRYGEEFVPPNLEFESVRRADLLEPPLLITPAMRGIIDDTFTQHCEFRSWHLFARNVRTNHVHAVVSAAGDADRMLTDLKAYLTRGLRAGDAIGDRRRVWTEGGSKRHLFTDEAVARACEYVYLHQGPDLPRE